MKFLKVLFLVCVVFLVGCSKDNSEKKSMFNVAVSVFPVYDIAKNIAGEKANVFYVVPPGANPHNYQVTPSQVITLSHVDLFVGVSTFFDGWIEKYISTKSGKYYLESKRINPHIWLSVKNAKKIAKKFAKLLSTEDRINEKYYQNNLKEYLILLDKLDIEISVAFNMAMFTNHL